MHFFQQPPGGRHFGVNLQLELLDNSTEYSFLR